MMNGRIRKERSSMPVSIIGNIKVGEKNAKGFPTSLGYFKADSSFSHFVELFNSCIGEKPTKLSIVFLSDNPIDSCCESLQLRDTSGKLYCEGNGEEFKVVKDDKWVSYSKEKIQEIGRDFFIEGLEKMTKTKFKRSLKLRFMIPDVKGVLGLWQLTTHADKSSIDSIIGVFDNMILNAGTVVMIPFDLLVKKVSSDRSGSRNSYPVLSLVPNISHDNLERIKELSGGIQTILTDEKIKLLS